MKSRAGLKFDRDIPEWMRRIIRRWYKRLNLGEWQIRVSIDPDAEEDDPTQATIATLPHYLDAHLFIRADVNRESFEALVVHELRHANYSWIEQEAARVWDGRRKLTRDEAMNAITAVIETLIQRDVDIFLK